jgi:muramoyltetrapeptide carboxypeptidase
VSGVLKPRALPARPIAAVLAPASSAQQARLDAGAAVVAEHGWELRWMPHAQGRQAPFFSATAQQRVADLHAAFADPEIDVLLCTRGGYGTNYLLPLLDLDLIAANPKPLLGYSDMTAMQTWIMDRTGLVSFHAPMLAADFYREDGVDDESLSAVLHGKPYSYGAKDGLRVLQAGEAEGRLHGGCLTLLAASLGTPYAAATEGCLLFLEDVGTRPYQVDRLLRQMWLAGKFAGVTGVVFGEMLDCASPGAPQELLENAILHALAAFEGPIAIGLRSGHVTRANVTLPLGVHAHLRAGTRTGCRNGDEADATEVTLQLLESAVVEPPSVRI